MAMRLMRASNVPETERDVLYRASRWHAVLLVLMSLGAGAAVLFYRWPAQKPSYYIAGMILLLLLALHRFVTARFHPQNWLVRKGDDGLFIHIRSYLNERLSPDDPTVMFLAYSEIRSARLVRERVEVLDSANQNKTETQIIRWVELELAIDPGPVAAALDAESSRPGAPEKRWYGSSTTLYRDYPAQMQVAPFLRIKWQAVPGPRAFLEALREHVEIAPEVKTDTNFAHIQDLPVEEQKKRLRDLKARGQVIPAVYLAQRIYRCNLTEAKRIVDGLGKG
ncbi:MAG: hypothetical protein ACRD3B_09525 [Candidatus Sulfotelmatobacter sp.]